MTGGMRCWNGLHLPHELIKSQWWSWWRWRSDCFLLLVLPLIFCLLFCDFLLGLNDLEFDISSSSSFFYSHVSRFWTEILQMIFFFSHFWHLKVAKRRSGLTMGTFPMTAAHSVTLHQGWKYDSDSARKCISFRKLFYLYVLCISVHFLFILCNLFHHPGFG